MYIPFDQMPDAAKVWIYPSDRLLTEAEIHFIRQQGSIFFEQWSAHGHALKCSFQVFYDKFLVLSVDESHHQASGCAIDASAAWVQSLEQAIGVVFFDRTQVCFMRKNHIVTFPITEIKEAITNGSISPHMKTFAPVEDLAALRSRWLVAAENSWMAKYFNKQNT